MSRTMVHLNHGQRMISGVRMAERPRTFLIELVAKREQQSRDLFTMRSCCRRQAIRIQPEIPRNHQGIYSPSSSLQDLPTDELGFRFLGGKASFFSFSEKKPPVQRKLTPEMEAELERAKQAWYAKDAENDENMFKQLLHRQPKRHEQARYRFRWDWHLRMFGYALILPFYWGTFLWGIEKWITMDEERLKLFQGFGFRKIKAMKVAVEKKEKEFEDQLQAQQKVIEELKEYQSAFGNQSEPSIPASQIKLMEEKEEQTRADLERLRKEYVANIETLNQEIMMLRDEIRIVQKQQQQKGWHTIYSWLGWPSTDPGNLDSPISVDGETILVEDSPRKEVAVHESTTENPANTTDRGNQVALDNLSVKPATVAAEDAATAIANQAQMDNKSTASTTTTGAERKIAVQKPEIPTQSSQDAEDQNQPLVRDEFRKFVWDALMAKMEDQRNSLSGWFSPSSRNSETCSNTSSSPGGTHVAGTSDTGHPGDNSSATTEQSTSSSSARSPS